MEWELDGKANADEKNAIEMQRVDRHRPDRPLPPPPGSPTQDNAQSPSTSPPPATEGIAPREGGEWRRNIPRRALPRPGIRQLPSELRNSENGLLPQPDGALRRRVLSPPRHDLPAIPIKRSSSRPMLVPKDPSIHPAPTEPIASRPSGNTRLDRSQNRSILRRSQRPLNQSGNHVTKAHSFNRQATFHEDIPLGDGVFQTAPLAGPSRPEFQSNLESLGDETFHLDETALRRLHARLLEGYHCWLKATGREAPARTGGVVMDLREALLWRVLQSLSETTSFCGEHLAMNYHAVVSDEGTRGDGSQHLPYHIALAQLQRGIADVDAGRVNLDDINYNALYRPQVPKPHGRVERTVKAMLFNLHPVYFCWEGPDTLQFHVQQHVDTQARSLERLLGQYVPSHSILPSLSERASTAPVAVGRPSKKGAQLSKSLSNNGSGSSGASLEAQSQPKWFHEPRTYGLLLLALTNYWSFIVFKVWSLVFALHINQRWTPGHFWRTLAITDAGMLVAQGILEVVTRLMCFRSRFFRSFPYSWAMTVLLLGLMGAMWVLACVVLTGQLSHIMSFSIWLPSSVGKRLWWLVADDHHLIINFFTLYILLRLVTFILYNIYLWLYFTPVIPGSVVSPHAHKRRIRLRTIGTLAFWLLVFAATTAFEIWVLIPAVSNLIPSQICDCSSALTCTYQYSLQCWVVFLVVWVLVFTNFLMDTHVAFVGLLSVIGMFVGITSRLRPQRSYQLRFEPLKVITAIRDKYLPPKEDLTRAMDVWDAIIEEMWEADLLSEAHCKQLKLNGSAPEEEWIIELSVPEAQERLSFFINALMMRSPLPPTLNDLQSVTTIIPCYDETILFSYEELRRPHYYGGKPGATDLEYLISCHRIEWEYFTMRLKVRGLIPWNWNPQQLFTEFLEKRLQNDGPVVDKIRLWASMRAQTVARTIRGVTMYSKALAAFGADARMRKKKFQVILALQTFATYDAAKLASVYMLMREFPQVEIVYEFDRFAHSKPQLRPQVSKLAFLESFNVDYAIVKEEWNPREEKLELTGVLPRIWPLLVGPEGARVQGKALNQRNGLMFAWGEVIQTLDGNQDATLEDAIKMPALMQAFYAKDSHGQPNRDSPWRYRIIGFRETIFTNQLSLAGQYMATADFSFVTIFSRVLANPLSVRMHYGHPDFFDAMWVHSRGALNKASPVLNLNEDIFAGYMATLRNQRITHKEFVQAKKGRETSLRLADQFEAKLSEGATAQLRSSDLFELNQRLNWLKKLSLFHGSVGFYVVMTIMAFSIPLYVLALLLFSLAGIGLEQLGKLGSIYSTELALALGLVYMLPGIIEQLITGGMRKAVSIVLNFVPSSLFFGFLLQTKAAHMRKAIGSGKAVYRSTGRKLTIERMSLKAMYLQWSNTHFFPGFNLLLLIFLYHLVAINNVKYVGVLPLFTPTILAFSWILIPTVFNPYHSYEAVSAEARDVWGWMSKKKDLDLCALSYAHPRGDKRLGVPPRNEVEEDSWTNWYLLSRAASLQTHCRTKSGIWLFAGRYLVFFILLAAYVCAMSPASLLCALYLLLLGLILGVFVAGVIRLLKLIARVYPPFDHIARGLTITLIFSSIFLAVGLVLVWPQSIAESFNLIDLIVGVGLLLFTLGFLRGLVTVLVCTRLRNRPKLLLTTIYYLSKVTLQLQLAWAASQIVIALQVLLGYVISFFGQLHTSLLYNPHLTTRTHGLDSLPRGSLRKLEKDTPAVLPVLANGVVGFGGGTSQRPTTVCK